MNIDNIYNTNKPNGFSNNPAASLARMLQWRNYLYGNRKAVTEEEIVKNAMKEEEVVGTHQQQDNGVLEII